MHPPNSLDMYIGSSHLLRRHLVWHLQNSSGTNNRLVFFVLGNNPQEELNSVTSFDSTEDNAQLRAGKVRLQQRKRDTSWIWDVSRDGWNRCPKGALRKCPTLWPLHPLPSIRCFPGLQMTSKGLSRDNLLHQALIGEDTLCMSRVGIFVHSICTSNHTIACHDK